MIARFVARASAFLVSLVVAGGVASAQNYDGTGLVKFGVFGEWTVVNARTSSAPATGLSSVRADGGMYGVSAAYDHIFARWFLIGAEIDLAVGGDVSNRLAGFAYNADYAASARARFGVFVHPDVLVYGTAGASWLGATIEKGSASAISGVLDSSHTVSGLVVGGGLEYDLRDFVLFAEYLYADYGSWPRPTAQSFNVDADSHTFRAGVKFKVGHDHRYGSWYQDSVKDPR